MEHTTRQQQDHNKLRLSQLKPLHQNSKLLLWLFNSLQSYPRIQKTGISFAHFHIKGAEIQAAVSVVRTHTVRFLRTTAQKNKIHFPCTDRVEKATIYKEKREGEEDRGGCNNQQEP